jgi:hypothetical protein
MSSTLSPTKHAFRFAKFAHELFLKAIEDFPADKAAFQPSPTDNHVLWQVGHIALDYHWFASALDGKPAGTSEADNKLFGMGSKPLRDAKAYPPLPELKKRLGAAWERMSAAAESLRDEDAKKPALIDTGGLLDDRLDAVVKVAWHDGWHTGQIAGIRKALGMKGLF